MCSRGPSLTQIDGCGGDNSSCTNTPALGEGSGFCVFAKCSNLCHDFKLLVVAPKAKTQHGCEYVFTALLAKVLGRRQKMNSSWNNFIIDDGTMTSESHQRIRFQSERLCKVKAAKVKGK